MKNIVLVGFMGTGKNVVGKKLAAALGMKYISTDSIIEAREKRSINDIFAGSGEPYFRKAEKDAVREASLAEGAVIAAGGGAVIDAENIEILKKNGLLVCLTASPEEILKRTGRNKDRPLLNVPDPLSKIKELLEKRKTHYARAGYTVDTTGKSVDEVVDEVIRIIKPFGTGVSA